MKPKRLESYTRPSNRGLIVAAIFIAVMSLVLIALLVAIGILCSRSC